MVLLGKQPSLCSVVTDDSMVLLGKSPPVHSVVAGDLAAEGQHSHFGTVA